MEKLYQTPIEVAQYMTSLLPIDVNTVLEPTPGEGNIVSQLTKYKVTAPQDYFLLDKSKKFDAVVMNAPFSSKSAILDNAPEKYIDSGMRCGYMILDECMSKSNIVIALVPWFTISDSDVRLRSLNSYGLKSITVLPRKTFNYIRIQTCIIELIKGYEFVTEFKIYENINKL